MSRPLPHSETAERACLGAVLLNPTEAGPIVLKRLTAEQFYLAKHQTIFGAMRAMQDSAKAVDAVTLAQRLHDEKLLEDVGGPAYLADLSCSLPTLTNLEDYLLIVEEKAMRRQLIQAAHDIGLAAYEDALGATEQVEMASRAVQGIAKGAEGRIARTLRPLAESATAYREWCERRDAVAVNLGRWLPTLSQGAGALAGGEMVVLLADTGVGKTACAQNLSLAVSPLKTALFELELPETLTYPRYLQIHHGISIAEVYHAHREGRADDWHADPFLAHVWLDSTSGLSVEEVERRVMAHNAARPDNPFRVVIVDYFQLLRGRGKDRYERFSNEAEAIKVAAKRTNAVWVVISQVRRPEGDAAEPGLHDAKETGSIENSAGLVLGLWRDSNDAETLYVKILKNTKGQSGKIITCNFHGPSLRITERVA
jgi:replicative DNA helicase